MSGSRNRVLQGNRVMEQGSSLVTGRGRPGAGWNLSDALLAVCGFGLACLVHGAVPGVLSPALLHSIWAGGFAQSLANDGWGALVAANMGIPVPAPVPFGLSGVWPMAVLIRCGVPLPDAYAAVVALWLLTAFAAATWLSERLGSTRKQALLMATLWLTLPMVWGHASYGMLALGIGLLPAYFASQLRFMTGPYRTNREIVVGSGMHVCVALVAVFMDGYTFVLYAVGSLILAGAWVCSRVRSEQSLRRLVTVPLVHLASLALAYVAYRRYVGEMPLHSGPLDVFRGWAVDLQYLVVPTYTMLAVFDGLGWSRERSPLTEFGDLSVWTTTFVLPLLLCACMALLFVRNGPRRRLALVVLGIAMVSFYMALGPSLKVMSTDYLLAHGMQGGGMMPAEAGLVETGSAWISDHIPGFNSMRASYRWLALTLLCMWTLVVLWLGQLRRPGGHAVLVLLIGLIVLQLPQLQAQVRLKHQLRQMFVDMDRAITAEFPSHELHGARVLFLPTGNDFLANWMAAKMGIRTFNVGGDKNVAMAREHWPAPVRNAATSIDTGLAQDVRNVLLRSAAEVVIVPNMDLLFGAHEWPCPARSRLAGISPWTVEASIASESKQEIRLPVDGRRSEQTIYLRLPDAVSPASVAVGSDDRVLGMALLAARWEPADASEPAAVREALAAYGGRADGSGTSAFPKASFPMGWHPAEPSEIWSRDEAQLFLPTPRLCMRGGHCNLVLSFRVFGASGHSPKRVQATNIGQSCPDQIRSRIASAVTALQAEPWLDVRQTPLLTSLRLRASPEGAVSSLALLEQFVHYPVATAASSTEKNLLLMDGWYSADPDLVWSSAQALLSIPVPLACRSTRCDGRLTFSAFSASPSRPVSVSVAGADGGKRKTWTLNSDAVFTGVIPLDTSSATDNLKISVSPATSPLALGLSSDARVLGIALRQVHVQASAAK